MNKPVIPVLVFGSNVVTSTLSRVKEGNTNILNGFILTSEKKKDFRFLSENKLHCSDVRRHSKEDHEMHFIAQEKANKWFVFFVKLRHGVHPLSLKNVLNAETCNNVLRGRRYTPLSFIACLPAVVRNA